MRRRDFIKIIGGAAAARPLAAGAQQSDGRGRRVGVLMGFDETDPEGQARWGLFRQTLADLGWIEGRNLRIDMRWTADNTRLQHDAHEIVAMAPDVILVDTGPALTAAQQATTTVPIVFTGVSEPVERGFVASLARPGGNSTGFTNLEATMGSKWLDLLKEIAPRVKHVTAMFHPGSSFALLFFRAAEAAGQKLGVEVVAAHVHDGAEIDAAVTAVARQPDAGLMLPPDGFTGGFRPQILELTARHRLPLIAQNRSF